MKINYFKLLDKVGNSMGIVPVHLSRSGVVKDSISTGSLVCDLIIGGGWPAGRWIALFGPEASCKAQPLYSKIKIPGGWVKMGDIKVGDIVCTPDGKTTHVTHILPQGCKDIYRITFTDGRFTDCCEEHLWKVYCENWTRKKQKNNTKSIKIKNAERILSLKEIINYLQNRKAKLFVPLTKPVFNDIKNLPLDPYILGLLLGDGYIHKITRFVNADSEIIENLRSKLLEGYELKRIKNTKYDYILTHGKKNIKNHYTEVLKNLGLQNKKSWEKFIPNIYKEASVEQRLEVLRGLMDTDGCVPKVSVFKGSGTPYISTSSKQLALDIQYIVRSIGGECKVKTKRSFFRYKKEKKEGRISYRCYIRYETPEKLLKLSRKKNRAIRSKNITLRSQIKSIEYLGKEECQCIVIDHSDHLYITDGFIVTHNSTLLYHTLRDALRQEVNAEFFDFEGSTDPNYLGKILDLNLNEVFGVRKQGGTWELAPKCRYHQPDLGEPYFRYIHRILKALPDKLQHNNQWYYVFDDKKQAGKDFDTKLYRATKRFWVPAEDNGAQVIWFIDSLAAMLTEKQDEKDENKEIGLQARMFSRYIPLVKSRLARKRCSIVAVNQIRMKPMSFGNPEYEVGGEAPRFYSDIRLQCRSCSNPFPGKSGQVEEEPCWDGEGTDKYRYIKVATRKNKCFSPFRNSLMRVWMEEKGDIGRGIDPVFDTFQFLTETRQVTKGDKRGTYKLCIEGLWTQRAWTWKEFKELMLNPNKAEVYTKYKLNTPEIGEIDPDNEDAQKLLAERLDLRKLCKKQVRSGEAFKLYFDTICGVDDNLDKEADKICGNCAKFRRDENCLEIDENTPACDDFVTEEEEDLNTKEVDT